MSDVYIGRKICGCCVAEVIDDNEVVGEVVQSFYKSGLIVERISWQQYKDVVSEELTFMNCPHASPTNPNPPLFLDVDPLNPTGSKDGYTLREMNL